MVRDLFAELEEARGSQAEFVTRYYWSYARAFSVWMANIFQPQGSLAVIDVLLVWVNALALTLSDLTVCALQERPNCSMQSMPHSSSRDLQSTVPYSERCRSFRELRFST